MIKNTTKKAFSLIETLIAATIIVILLYALVAAGRGSLNRSSSLHEKAQAMLLAQQGLEIVRQIRDTNWIDATQQNWSDFVYNSSSTPKWSSNTADNLKISFAPSPLSRFVLVPALTSNDWETISVDKLDYSRKVNCSVISDASMPPNNTIGSGGDVLPAENAVKVTVTVGWDNGSAQTTSISEVLTNWRPNY